MRLRFRRARRRRRRRPAGPWAPPPDTSDIAAVVAADERRAREFRLGEDLLRFTRNLQASSLSAEDACRALVASLKDEG